jgi:1,4-alpha-glucan branching enzyme
MLRKMPGDEWQQFANLRLMYSYMFRTRVAKLLFMGAEFGQGDEWNYQNRCNGICCSTLTIWESSETVKRSEPPL